MLETMHAAPGIGLAAPQIGVLKRVVVVDIDREETKTGPLFMANPEIVEASDEDADLRRGMPLGAGAFRWSAAGQGDGPLPRPRRREQDMPCEGLLATCVQHEIDHLDGVLFIDHISALKRNMMGRRAMTGTRWDAHFCASWLPCGRAGHGGRRRAGHDRCHPDARQESPNTAGLDIASKAEAAGMKVVCPRCLGLRRLGEDQRHRVTPGLLP